MCVVRLEGLEPSRIAPLDSESSVYYLFHHSRVLVLVYSR